ncbi:MAG TPA: conjugal transfer protein TraH [Candidatus Aphodousia faecigallinarum]|uniref:Conjugal transfer protein TraH n=1 Tax=Candidatus Aphodousia faecigallinarum TaxID=2840677 RepID=A0A9D1IHT6_9BURK|nr:conjugal transfer protein TraH [Candidatus Aphodousia faecigallinarum]
MRKQTLALCLCLMFSGASFAGFLEDFYDSSSGLAQGNVTAAGIYESAHLNIATAGGFVYRAPRSDFTPFQFTPPKLSAGCGGIDLFMGAFSIPSKEEFLNYLRAIGSSLPGLAFQLALQTLSPDLSEQVTSFRDLIREYSSKFQDSCAAAQTLLDMTGAQGYMQKLKYSASNHLRDSGVASDAFEADAMTRTDGTSVFKHTPTRTDSGGNAIEAGEINLTWSLLGGGTLTHKYPKELKELMMTLVGTSIYTQSGDDSSAVVRSRFIMGEDIASLLFGSAETVSLSGATRLSCPTKDTKCLYPERVAMDDINLTHRLWEAATNYRQALLSRDASRLSEDDVLLLGSVSSIPLIRLINTVTTHRYAGFSEDLLRVYVEAASYEAIVRALDQLTLDIEKVITSASGAQANAINADHVRRISARIASVRLDLASRSDRIYQQMSRAQSFMEQIEHIERSLLGNTAHNIASRWITRE